MGVLDRFSGLCDFSFGSRKLRQHDELQTLEIKVRMDCEGCARKVMRSVEGMNGVTQIDVNQKQNKLTVTGYVDTNKVLRRVRWKTGKKAVPWPYVPYEEVAHPYAAGVYDKKAPAGYVRNDIHQHNPLGRASSREEKYTNAFSDENPNSCVVM